MHVHISMYENNYVNTMSGDHIRKKFEGDLNFFPTDDVCESFNCTENMFTSRFSRPGKFSTRLVTC